MSEQQNTEWKETWQDDYLKVVAAFANTEGGTLYIGKDDEGKATGLANSKKLLEDLPNKIRNSLGLVCEVRLQKEEDKDFIEIIVKPYSAPISYRGKYYVRSGSTTQQLSGHDLNDLVLKKAGKDWDEVVEPRAGIRNINEEAVEFFKRKAVQSGRLPHVNDMAGTEELLKKLKVVNEKGEYLRAALLLFAKDPRDFFLTAYIKIGRFGTSPSDLLSQEVVEGNALELADKTLEILDNKYFVKRISYQGLQRIETPPYPYEAIREILFNAIIHREYQNTPITIRLYEDRMTVWNQGELNPNLTIDELKQSHSSYPRNKLLADVFYKAGYIETWGRGTLKIIEECEKHGLPEPEIKTVQGGFAVTLFQKFSVEVLFAGLPLNDRQKKAVIYVDKHGFITNSTYQETTGASRSTAFRDLDELINLDVFTVEGEGKSTRYKLKR